MKQQTRQCNACGKAPETSAVMRVTRIDRRGRQYRARETLHACAEHAEAIVRSCRASWLM